ncbi:MAG: hypothetical protein IID46_15920 [Planctomycetes bacterium]|nr:hypothetical protein [Planctomycetota bacterium]
MSVFRKNIPALATHWAYGKNGKTIYYKLNPKARWSDGTPVTSHDFGFTLEFMRSKHIRAPWYNEYYGEQIERAIAFDDHTYAFVGSKPKTHFETTAFSSILR